MGILDVLLTPYMPIQGRLPIVYQAHVVSHMSKFVDLVAGKGERMEFLGACECIQHCRALQPIHSHTLTYKARLMWGTHAVHHYVNQASCSWRSQVILATVMLFLIRARSRLFQRS